MEITVTAPTHRGYHYGVWSGSPAGRPLGRVREVVTPGGVFLYRAFTNRRAPGDAFLGTFQTMEQAAVRVAREHDIHSTEQEVSAA